MSPLSFDFQMLWPIVAIVCLTLASGARLLGLRISALKARDVKMDFYRSYRAGEEPEDVAVATRHFSNLYETPVLFYLGCLVAGILGPATMIATFAAWGFVSFRILQSLVHLTSNNVRYRAYAFWASCLMLFTLWGTNVAALIGTTT